MDCDSSTSVAEPLGRSGMVVWITGLSGAGKTTLSAQLAMSLSRRGQPVCLLDGDDLLATRLNGRCD